MAKLGEILALIGDPYRVRILENKRPLFVGWVGTITANEHTVNLDLNRDVKRIAIAPEIRHSRWRDLGLMPPPEPELDPAYDSEDLEMWIYFDVHIIGREEES